MYSKWYLKTWFISLIFFLGCASPIFIFVGIILCILQIGENRKLVAKYGAMDELDNEIYNKNTHIHNLNNEFEKSKERNEEKLQSLKNELKDVKRQLKLFTEEVDIEQYNFSDYDCLSSDECKNKLSLLKIKANKLISTNKAIVITSEDSKKELNNNIKQLIRCFNSECDNILLNLSVKNIDSSRSKLLKSFESLNKIFVTDGLELTHDFLELKLEELNLVYTYELKKEQEREQQKAIKEQMLEEEKVRREIERQRKEIAKDQSQFTNELNKLMKYMQSTTNDVEKQLYVDKIKELEDKLKELETKKATIDKREENAKAGFVYVISNIGSFGDNIYKIGMTRRLEPMDRIKELSSASVPFEFDVHAMIFSDDAPALESSLHEHFRNNSVNKINLRKEFFEVSLDEIEQYVINNFNNTAAFTKTALAREYRQSLELKNEALVS